VTVKPGLKKTPRPASIIPRLGVSGRKKSAVKGLAWRTKGEARTEAVAAAAEFLTRISSCDAGQECRPQKTERAPTKITA